MNQLKRVGLLLVWTLCLIALSSLGSGIVAAEVIVDEIVPAAVEPGDFFLVRGQFTGVEAASAFLSDGVAGLPVEVVRISDREIVCRAGATPWSMIGAVHVLPHLESVQLEERRLERETYEVRVRARLAFGQEVAHGGVLSVEGGPGDSTVSTIANDGRLGVVVQLPPCPGEDTTYLVVIEPDSENPGQTTPCYPAELNLEVLSSIGPLALSADQHAHNLAEAFNQSFAPYGLSMAQGSSSTQGTQLLIDYNGCEIVSGAVEILCDDKNNP